MTGTVRVAGAQLNVTVGDIAGNVAKLTAAARQAAAAGAEILVTSEMAISGYPPEDLVGNDTFVADCRAAVSKFATAVAAFAPELTVLVGTPWDAAAADSIDAQPRTRLNAVAVVTGGEVTGVYGKQWLPTYGVFDEARHFAPGADAAATWTTAGAVRFGALVCEDIWRPGPAEAQRNAGARLLAVANASPWSRGKGHARDRVITDVATRTRLAVVYVNQVGGQDQLLFDGRSTVTAADGTVLHRSPAWEEDIFVVDVPLDGRTPPGRVVGLPSTGDDELADIWAGLTVGLADYVTKAGFARAVVGLSGGIDSAVTVALAVDALGADRVRGITMPSPHSSAGSVNDSYETGRLLGIDVDTVEIGELMACFDAALAPLWDAAGAAGSDVTEENIQARIRAVILMAVSNKLGHLLINTGNRSEASVGYSTVYGDATGAIGPLLDVPKGLVYELARWRNRQPDGPRIPASTLDKAPSAELAPGQTDADSLPDYDTLDAILEALVVDEADPARLVTAGFDAVTVAKVARMVAAAEHKRRQSPPALKVTGRAYTRERRYPINNRWVAAP